jgi:hypothetical protein
VKNIQSAPKPLAKRAARAAAIAILALFAAPASGYIEVPYSLGRLVAESTNICVIQVEEVDKENNRILYKKVRDVKGTHPSEVLLHNIGKAGFHPREWQNTMAWAEPGKIAVFMYNGNASETCIDMYWYQAYGGGRDWGMSHAEPFLLRSFAGRPEKLVMAVEEIMAGKEVVVPAMMDGDKNAIQLRTAKVQRLRASLKLNDYNASRDFIGWGSEDFRRITFMPGFSHMASLSRVDPDARGLVAADVDGDGDSDLCLFGEKKVVLVQPDGPALNEISLPVQGGARGASFADYNGDGKLDLLLACPTGAKLLTNTGTAFKDDSAMLPKEAYNNVTAAAWIDGDADGRPDILVANGFDGLRLFRNPAAAAAVVPKAPAYGPWHFIGGFSEGNNFDAVFPPEKEIKLDAKYKARGGVDVAWVKKEWPDGAVHDFLAHNPQPLHDNVANYIYREIDASGAAEVVASFGSDDTLTVWVNGQKVHAENVGRGAAPDQAMVKLPLKAGKNQLLVKICNGGGPSGFYFAPKAPEVASGPPFEDWTAKAGLGPDGRAGTVKGDHLIVADFNGDGRQDAFYAAAEGVLLLNFPTGFVEARPLAGVRLGGVVPAAGDVDGDKDLDLVVPQAKGVKVFRNDGKGAFADAGGLPGFEGRATSAAFVELTKKGQLDLIVGCLGEPNRFYRNAGGKFTEASKDIGLDKRVLNSRLAAAADVNKDGVWDIVFNNEGQDPFILLGDPNK